MIRYLAVVLVIMVPWASGQETLRDAAEKQHLKIGAAVLNAPLANDVQYASTLAQQFHILVPEGAMKFKSVHPAADQYTWQDADALVDFARSHQMQVQGTTLLWHDALPLWIRRGTFTREELTTIIRDHIHEVVGRYRGKVKEWVVVNEAIDDGEDGGYRPNIFLNVIGPEYINMAFQFAREADPDAKLIYNDFGCEGAGGKSEGVIKLVEGLKAKQVPIDAVGFQCHWDLNYCGVKLNDLEQNIRRLRSLGLEVQVTELDIRLPPFPDAKALEKQAAAYHDVVTACRYAGVSTIILWGFTDKYTWIPKYFRNEGAPLPFDSGYGRKPAWYSLRDALSKELEPKQTQP